MGQPLEQIERPGNTVTLPGDQTPECFRDLPPTRPLCIPNRARARREAFNEAADIARAHQPEHGWGTSTKINDAWASGYRDACREISETLQNLPIAAVENK